MNIKMIAVSLSLFLMISCSDHGYIEVRNKTGATINDVTVGESISIGTVDSGREKGVESEKHGTYYITFSQNGRSYRSKESYSIDVRTSATFIFNDSGDVDEVPVENDE